MANENKTPVDIITHGGTRANIPPAELEPVLSDDDKKPIRTAWDRRNRDLDPQLVWRGKDPDQAELTVDAPPIFLQEQVHPKALIDDLRNGRGKADDLFGHFGLTEEDREAEIEFYRHTRKWSNRMILGDGLQVMASLAEREGLKGQVQAIYIDPPYGIKFNSNFQWSTTSRDVKDGKFEHLTREPEQVKAFRDTWRDGIHSYLSYLRDRLTVARELLTESGSCFVQIGDENVHRVRGLMDEVFGTENFVAQISYSTTTGRADALLSTENDYVLFYCRDKTRIKFRPVLVDKDPDEIKSYKYRVDETRSFASTLGKTSKQSLIDSQTEKLAQLSFAVSQDPGKPEERYYSFQGLVFDCGRLRHWKTRNPDGLNRLAIAGRLFPLATQLNYIRLFDDNKSKSLNNIWLDTGSAGYSSADPKRYVVQTDSAVIQRCLLMATDPGDLVLDPTCGSGTTAYVAEQWGRRWITIDTSRVALALARARIMGAKYPWYLLADSVEGQKKAAEVARTAPATGATYGDVRHGFVYERVPRITLKSIANNTEIDVVWRKMQPAVEDARAALNAALAGHNRPFKIEIGGRAGKSLDFTAFGEVTLPSGETALANGFMEWEIPREAPDHWPQAAKKALENFWKARIARQKEIDASIAAKAEFENLYDRPYADNKRIRVAGPFTVESLSPHAISAVDEHGELIDEVNAADGLRTREEREADNFRKAIMENLAKAGVHQSGKADAIRFDTLAPWPGEWIGGEGRYMEGEVERRAAIFIGPEYGTVSRPDLVACAREAADAGFDIVIACAFNFEAHAQELHKLGRVPILHARMNADLHMAGDLKAGGGNLFVVFGEPEIELQKDGDRYRVELKGVDIFKPATGEVVSSEPDDIACWFIDTDYTGESFFVRQAYFPGADVPYKALRSTLKAEIDEEAWESLKLTVSRPFAKPKSGRIAVKVINHLGDEVMKVLGV
ncbi:site-specific DNA-methyltransferase [Agrobacterium tumefaciens]|uniref:site-specific DNA-methyltransferase n=1 Tax=Agrobacterium tumefaciens TaxID=358 RepID=UPI001574D7DE|nr:site-specific DNA-methyltransferase [Agrobacterium tumefaciens]NTB96255.1 site-specific DNA-methyltransferase [Agrobacterium tumefaciens]NTC46780.1 site-specific DNA-methyltransferase [Agrobacterium tumefaciens]